MIPYNYNFNLQGIAMNKGKNKDGIEYDRTLQAKNGMSELINIVAGLQKDVKRINNCLTLSDATVYAAKKGPNWQAHEADITGPNGKPDGIKEVFVTDANGNIRVINGYTLAKTTYPTRKLYYSIKPTTERKNKSGETVTGRMPFSEFKHKLYQIHEGFDEQGAPKYEWNLGGFDEEFKNLRPDISPKDLFKKFVFQPVYEFNKESFNGLFEQNPGLNPSITKAVIANKSLKLAYEACVRNPAITHVFQNVFRVAITAKTADKKMINKALRRGEFLTATQSQITDILNNTDKFNKAQDICNQAIDKILKQQYNYNRDQSQQFAHTIIPQHQAFEYQSFNTTDDWGRASALPQQSVLPQESALPQVSADQTHTEMNIEELGDDE